MSVEIACPSCAARLNLPESLLGTQVRCASCQTAFPAPGLMDGPANPIKLELDSEPAAGPAIPIPPVPLPAEPREVPPSEAAPRPKHAEPSDQRECPSCGAIVRQDMRRCYRCGERLPRLDWPETERDRLQRDPSRRDSEPHRGGLVLALGILGLVFFAFCGPVGMVLSLCAWVTGRADLARIRAGTMDREGETNSHIGMVCGIVGVPLNALWLIGCVAFWLFVAPEIDRPQNQQPLPPRFGEPQKEWKGKKW